MLQRIFPMIVVHAIPPRDGDRRRSIMTSRISGSIQASTGVNGMPVPIAI
jgi:hypothetical protein